MEAEIKQEIQTDLFGNWLCIKAAIDSSNKPRIKYKEILGRSLTSIITECRINNLSFIDCYKRILKILQEQGIYDLNVYTKVKHNIHARYCEQEVYLKRIKNAK